MTWIDLVKLQQHWWRSKKQQQGPMSLPTMTKVDEDGIVASNTMSPFQQDSPCPQTLVLLPR